MPSDALGWNTYCTFSSPHVFTAVAITLTSSCSNHRCSRSPSALSRPSRHSPPRCPSLCLPSSLPHGLRYRRTLHMPPACPAVQAGARWPSFLTQRRWPQETITLTPTPILESMRFVWSPIMGGIIAPYHTRIRQCTNNNSGTKC